jgi:hypothetical protein
MAYENHELVGLARIAPGCMVPGCGATNHGQVVSMHSNQGRDGKGMGIKASDAMIAFGCYDCHMTIDHGSAPIEIRTAMWEDAHRATMRWLIESGHLVASLTPQPPPKPLPKVKVKIKSGAKLHGRKFQTPTEPREIPSRKTPWPKRAT